MKHSPDHPRATPPLDHHEHHRSSLLFPSFPRTPSSCSHITPFDSPTHRQLTQRSRSISLRFLRSLLLHRPKASCKRSQRPVYHLSAFELDGTLTTVGLHPLTQTIIWIYLHDRQSRSGCSDSPRRKAEINLCPCLAA